MFAPRAVLRYLLNRVILGRDDAAVNISKIRLPALVDVRSSPETTLDSAFVHPEVVLVFE